MSVRLLRPYQGFAAGATATFPNDTETALVAQGLATLLTPTDSMGSQPAGSVQQLTVGGNTSLQNVAGIGVPSPVQAPSKLPNTPLGAIALTGYNTNGTVHVAGTMNLSEIYVPALMAVTGVGVLNGTTVGTNNMLVALYGADGTLIANSAVAGVLTAGASTFQEIPFTAQVVLPPGKYFIGVQMNGTTDTTRRLVSTFQPNALTAAVAGTFGTIPATITVPTTHTTLLGVIAWLYT
jgi:hypothetical protein